MSGKSIGKLKNRILKILGFSLVFFGVFMLVAGVGITIEGEKDNGPGIAVFSLIFFIPGATLLYLERRSSREMETLETVASAVRSYRRIKLVDLAAKVGITVPRANRLLMKAVALKMIEGNFDRTTDEFFTSDSREQKLEFKFCPQCGSPLDRVYLEGETVKCGRCGGMM
ncbi:MAG: hypothetical protein KBA61_07955 [Spirochaetes bacterium]|nr:hypothetical protein [Spirochaetota bacterium]